MIEPRFETQRASDGYPIHVTVWRPEGPARGRVVILHGVQSHGGWYHRLGRTLAGEGYETHFPDRRGSGSNRNDRGHAPSAQRLIDDVAERLAALRDTDAASPITLAGISWGGKTAVVVAADHPELVDRLALICPGLQPRVGVPLRERLRIALAYFVNRRRTFPIPLGDPALFTADPAGRQFIASDPLGLHRATAGLLAASTFLDRRVAKALPRVSQPALLMTAGHDRIVDNEKTLACFRRLPHDATRVIHYPEAHHTLEFEPDPGRYALDLCRWIDSTTVANPAGESDVMARR